MLNLTPSEQHAAARCLPLDCARTTAASYLLTIGAARKIEPSRRRGFDWAVHIPGCIQHMTTAQLSEFARNERAFRA